MEGSGGGRSRLPSTQERKGSKGNPLDFFFEQFTYRTKGQDRFLIKSVFCAGLHRKQSKI